MKKQKQTGILNIGVLIIILLTLVGGGIYLSKNNSDTKKNTDSSDTSKKVVNLSNKGLTKAPEYIFDQSNIVELDLSDNSIDGALQSQIQKLQNLKVLNLSNNKFTGVPAEVGQLKKLEILDLSNNQLTGLPNELGNLSNLKLLDLTGNNYSEADLTTIRKNLPSQTVIKTN
jgi:Leucine-rich repeat (LRR) protein